MSLDVLKSSGVLNTVIVVSVASLITIFGAYWYKQKKRNQIPELWKPVGKVISLYLYPLKSGRGIELQEAQCTELGLKGNAESGNVQLRDRSLIVFKASNNEFKTARTYPRMVLIEVSLHDNTYFVFEAPGMRQLYVNIPVIGEGEEKLITIWNDEKIPASDCGDEAAIWFSRYILDEPTGLRLGYHFGEVRRDITTTHREDIKRFMNLNNKATGMYSDLSSYLLINKASVDELNTRLPESVSVRHFRPNIVIEGEDATAFTEDNWDWIKIGDVIFRNVKPCTRCIFITINPDTAIRNPKREPLKTLESYRLLNKDQKPSSSNLPAIGLNLGVNVCGEIHVNDTIYIGK